MEHSPYFGATSEPKLYLVYFGLNFALNVKGYTNLCQMIYI